jgi:hypothetical protein
VNAVRIPTKARPVLRVILILVLAYVLGFLVEVASGQSNLTQVGWTGSPFAPLAVEGFVVGLGVGGWVGVLLSPVPFLAVPRTVTEIVDIGAALRARHHFGYFGVFFLAPLFATLLVAGVVGALVGWPIRRRWRRRNA